MKNIHILPTSQPSRLVKQKYDTIDRLCLADMATKRAEYKRFNLYITSDEDIEKGNWVLKPNNTICKISDKNILDYIESQSNSTKKIILTTDVDLIKDGVQKIDNEFLEWFVKNSSCEKVKVTNDIIGVKGGLEFRPILGYKIIIPNLKEQCTCTDECLGYLTQICKRIEKSNKQETLEEVKPKDIQRIISSTDAQTASIEIVELFTKWQQERSYSEEEVLNLLQDFDNEDFSNVINIEEWFEQNKKK
jgi:hypothetical protein